MCFFKSKLRQNPFAHILHYGKTLLINLSLTFEMYYCVRFEYLLGMAFCHYACAYERLNCKLDEMLYDKSVERRSEKI